MKKYFIILLMFSIKQINAQIENLYSIQILKNDTTIRVVNSDTSYIYNAFIVSEAANSINSVRLIMHEIQNSQWGITQDSIYAWSGAVFAAYTNSAFNCSKLNTNIFNICLGRFYFSSRKKISFTISTPTGILTKEFNF